MKDPSSQPQSSSPDDNWYTNKQVLLYRVCEEFCPREQVRLLPQHEVLCTLQSCYVPEIIKRAAQLGFRVRRNLRRLNRRVLVLGPRMTITPTPRPP